MKTSLFVASALLLATSAFIPAALADQRIPAPQMYAPPQSAPYAYAPPAAYTPSPPAPAQGIWGTDSTVPAKIGSPKQP